VTTFGQLPPNRKCRITFTFELLSFRLTSFTHDPNSPGSKRHTSLAYITTDVNVTQTPKHHLKSHMLAISRCTTDHVSNLGIAVPVMLSTHC